MKTGFDPQYSEVKGGTPRGFESLSPWDAIGYFRTPIETPFALTALAVPILVSAFDPMKIAILFCAKNTPVAITTLSGQANNFGLILPVNSPFYISYAIFGNLAQADWYASGAGATPVLQVIETKMSSWPIG